MPKSSATAKKNTPKIVLDTNVLVSGVLTPDGSPGKILLLLTKPDAVRLLVSPEILTEYLEVLTREKFGLQFETVAFLLHNLAGLAENVIPKQKLDLLPDPDDNKFLECAVEGKTSYLITGNIKHFPFTIYKQVRIITPATFIKNFK